MGARFALFASASLIACSIDQRTDATGTSSGGGSAGSAASGGFPATGGSAGSAGSPALGGSGGTIEAGTGGAAGAPNGGSAGAGAVGGSGSGVVDYVATVADCVGAIAPNPDVCAAVYQELHLDVSADYLGATTSRVFLRFDIDNQIAGAKSLTAELILRNVNGSTSSGEVHEVAPFVRNDLFSNPPGLGPVIAPDLGPVTYGQPVSWQLSTAPSANQPFCMALSTNTSDGIGYATLASVDAPILRVTYTN